MHLGERILLRPASTLYRYGYRLFTTGHSFIDYYLRTHAPGFVWPPPLVELSCYDFVPALLCRELGSSESTGVRACRTELTVIAGASLSTGHVPEVLSTHWALSTGH